MIRTAYALAWQEREHRDGDNRRWTVNPPLWLQSDADGYDQALGLFVWYAPSDAMRAARRWTNADGDDWGGFVSLEIEPVSCSALD